MTLEEFDPEIFSKELYNAYGIWSVDTNLYIAARVGYCDASRLLVRPKCGEYALMIEFDNGARHWFHITSSMIIPIRERLERRAQNEKT